MAVYVDYLRATARTRAWPFTLAAHMLADDVDELHAFAASIGLKREWFQRGSTPHYDLTATRHKRALELGAIRLDRRSLVALMRRLREQPLTRKELEPCPPATDPSTTPTPEQRSPIRPRTS